MHYIKMCLLLLLLNVIDCAAGAPGPVRMGVSAQSLVQLARLKHAQPEPTWNAEGNPGWGSMRDRWEPSCAAFAVERLGRVQLATAAHCVTDGPEVRYFRTFGLGTARVQYLNEARDLAYLDVDDPALDPIAVGPAPSEGEAVQAISPLYDATAPGRVDARYAEGWYETTQTIVYGWSGSPELDASGRVVGVVAKCPNTLQGQPCTPGHALVTALDL